MAAKQLNFLHKVHTPQTTHSQCTFPLKSPIVVLASGHKPFSKLEPSCWSVSLPQSSHLTDAKKRKRERKQGRKRKRKRERKRERR